MLVVLAAISLDSLNPYVIESTEADEQGRTTFRLYSRAPRRKLWVRTVAEAFGPAWTADGRGLALASTNNWDLIVWREGRGMRFYRGVVPASDGLLQMTWSPDRRLMLFRIAGTQGAWVMNCGQVVCVNLSTGARKAFANQDVVRAEWIDDRTIRMVHREFWDVGVNPIAPNYKDTMSTQIVP